MYAVAVFIRRKKNLRQKIITVKIIPLYSRLLTYARFMIMVNFKCISDICHNNLSHKINFINILIDFYEKHCLNT